VFYSYLFYADSKIAAGTIWKVTNSINRRVLMNVKNVVNIDGPQIEIKGSNMKA